MIGLPNFDLYPSMASDIVGYGIGYGIGYGVGCGVGYGIG